MFRNELGYGLHGMLKARVLLSSISRDPQLWRMVKASMVLGMAMLLWFVRVMMPDLWSVLLELLFTIWIPVVAYFVWLKSQSGQDAAANKGKSAVAPGPLSFIRDIRLRYFTTFILLPGAGWLLWDWRKRLFAVRGPAVNATVYAVMASKDFSKAIASLVLLPLVSEVTAAYQANDTPRLLQVVGTGLGIGALAALLMQCCIWTFASSILSLFEGAEPLLEHSPMLLRIITSAFVSCVINDALMGIMAGTNNHMLIGECLVPGTLFGLTSTFLFSAGMPLAGMAASMAANEVSQTVILGLQVLGILQRLQQKAIAPDADAAKPVSISMILKDMSPSKEVLWNMLSAAGNSGIRNMALRLKDFLSGMSAARLGNVEGSTYNLQQTVKAYLAGPAGLTGLFAANGAPLMLELNSLALFVLSLKGALSFLVFASMVWYRYSASEGAEAVLRIGGVLSSLVSMNATANATGAVDELCLNSTCNVSSAPAAAANFTAADGVAGNLEDYLGVLTPLNHWAWTISTMANEVAAPFDGFLVVLGDFRSIGIIYAFDFVVVLLPVLWATHQSAKRGVCLLPGPLGALPGCNAFTGVVMAGFCWAAVRLVGVIVVIFWVHVPRLRRRQETLMEACTVDVIEGYLSSRASLPHEEVVAFQAEHRKNPMFRFRSDGPWALWAKEHHTSMEAMAIRLKKFTDEGNQRIQRSLAIYWPIWGDLM